MKKRKIPTAISCLLIAAAVFNGCSADFGRARGIVTTQDSGSENVSTQDVAIYTDGTADDSRKEQDVDTADGSGKEVAGDTASVTIAEQTLIDQDDIVITAQEYVADNIWGDGIKVLIENNADKDVTVGCNALIVNDYMISDLFVAEVAAGKKVYDTIDLFNSELKAAGIDTVGKVEIYFHVYDSSTYDTLFNSDCVTIQTSGYLDMDTTPDDAGEELYNEGGIRIVGKAVDENSFWGTAVLLYCENTSGTNVGISVDDMSVNGYMMTPFFATTVYDGKKAIDDITIFESDLEQNGIDSVRDIELKFHIYNADTYDTISDSEVIAFSVQ